jgi:hypothetical protein
MPRSLRFWLLEANAMVAVVLLAAALVKLAYEIAGTTLWLAALRDAPWWTGAAGIAGAVLLLAGAWWLDSRGHGPEEDADA